jgi:hypothetical protein
MIPEFSEFPISHLNENLSAGFAMGAYDVLGDRLLSDHIGYPVENLAHFTQLNVKVPAAVGGVVPPFWSGNLLIR